MTIFHHLRTVSAHWASACFVVGLGWGAAALGQGTPTGQAPEGPPPQPLPHPELPAVPLPPSVTPLWVWLALGAVVAILLSVVVVLLFTRPKPVQKISSAQPRRDAIAALTQLRAEADQLPPPTVAARVSMILRSYLEARYRIPASRRTTPELFSGQVQPEPLPVFGTELFIPKAAPGPSSSPLKPFAPLAEFWDRLAFAPTPATDADALQLIETATTRIQEDPA